MQTVELAAAVLAGKQLNKDEYSETDWEYLYKFSCFHGVSGLVAYALNDFKNIPQNVIHAFENDQNWIIYRDARQTAVITKLLNEFENNHFSAMPLKGYWIKPLYPMPELRSMGDIDILIKREEYPEIDKVLRNIGCKYIQESAHEYIYTHPAGIKIELHKSLVPSYNTELYNYYGDGWRFAVREKDYEYIYKMTDRDFYVYIVAHAAKHYLNAGFGIRQVADLFVMKNKIKFSEADLKYINVQLEKLGLAFFYKKLFVLAEKWFDMKEPSEDVSEMEEYILKSGVYGTEEHKRISEIYRASAECSYTKAKLKNVIRLFFPKLKNMKSKYPRLESHRLLYPWYAAKRLLSIVFIKKEKLSAVSDRLVSDSEVEKYASHWESLGIKKTL